MSKNMDRRVRKTRAQLRQGLAELLKEKSLKEITVKELVEKVDINRSSGKSVQRRQLSVHRGYFFHPRGKPGYLRRSPGPKR